MSIPSDPAVVVIVRQESPVTIVNVPPPQVVQTVQTAPGVQLIQNPAPEVIVTECPQGVGSDFPFVPPIAFGFGDAPAIVWTSPANGVFELTRVVFDVAFNGLNPTLRVGVIGNIEALMAADQNDPTRVAAFEATSDFEITAGTGLWLEIHAGIGCTLGAGVLFVDFVPEG